MHVLELWRHPVKSMQGERIDSARFDESGLDGDRAWGLRDEATGNILTGRREPSLLLASARWRDGGPEITLPDGQVLGGTGPATDAALTTWVGRPIRLVAAQDQPRGVAEFFEDATDDTSPADTFTMPAGRFVDALPLLIVTTASLRQGVEDHPDGAWDVRRFRPNVLVEVDGVGWLEDDWSGHTVRVGEVELRAEAPCTRCTMVTRSQPGLERDLDVYRTLAREHGGTFGVWATVRGGGHVREGDAVTVVA